MYKSYLQTGAILGGLAVALGAFGAHGLKKLVPPETVTTFQTGVQYQMYHALALILIALVYEKYANKFLQWAGRLFITGIILFSGSLYLMTILKAMDMTGMEKIGIITPLGGLAFIAGWLMLLVGVMRKD
ncbi:MAG: DUF423 domain-containing protein [Terrimonas sp.]|nr:DUF423 domain-containing protein [Terrimonas sp.]